MARSSRAGAPNTLVRGGAPPLVDLAINSCAAHLLDLAARPNLDWTRISGRFLEKILDTVRARGEPPISPELLIQVFLHNWDSPTLDLEGIESARHKLVWSYLSHDAVGQDLGQNLTSLVINQLQIRDALLIPALREMPRLAIFEARANIEMTDAALVVLANSCPALTRVNINFTAVSMAGVRHLLSLESLKTAKLGWINFSSHPLVAAMALQAPIAPLSNLKLRSTQICDKSLESLLSAMVSHEIETLDLMGTKIKSVGSLALLAPTLKKLNLSFCDLRMDHLLSALPKFQLAEFIMGGCKTFRSSDAPVLAKCLPHVRRLALFDTPQLRSAKCFLLECPKLENLDLRHTGVNAESFLAALDEGSALPRLAQLDISSTAIGDNIAGFLVAVGSTLESCGLRFTQITASTVEIIAECCPRVRSLDLEGCRGIPVRQRRTLFEDLVARR